MAADPSKRYRTDYQAGPIPRKLYESLPLIDNAAEVAEDMRRRAADEGEN